MKKEVTKEDFINKYSELLQMTREEVRELELQDAETVIINYTDGYKRKVNIAADSAMAIIRDVSEAGVEWQN